MGWRSVRISIAVVVLLGGCVRAGFDGSRKIGADGGDDGASIDQRLRESGPPNLDLDHDAPAQAFPGGWGRRCELLIQATKVQEKLTSFPVLLTEDSLPAEMFDADGPHAALDGGGNIRFSADAAGTQRLACEIVTFATDKDPANGRAQIFVNVPQIDPTTNTSIWVWYDNKTVDLGQPAGHEPFGRHETWNDGYVGVWHMDEASGAILDSTANNNDAAPIGDPSHAVAGPVGSAISFDGAGDKFIANDHGSLDLSSLTVSVWTRPNSPVEWGNLLYKGAQDTASKSCNYQVARGKGTELAFDYYSSDSWNPATAAVLDDGVWRYYSVTFDPSLLVVRLFKDGVLHVEKQQSFGLTANDHELGIGGGEGSKLWTGDIDELRLSRTVRSAGWIAAAFNNMSSPATFVVAGTPSSQ